MGMIDRILTVVITATLTSAVWIVAGGSLIEMADSDSQRDATRPAEAAPSPTPTETPEGTDANAVEEGGEAKPPIAPLGEDTVNPPDRAETAQLIVPVLNVRPSDLTDTFSDERDGGQLHEAIDIMAPAGTSVVSAAPGTIEKIFESDAGGKTVFIRSNDRQSIHYYAHLDKYADGIKEGQRVRRGQRLGEVGSTGNASPKAPHLHFAIFRTTVGAEWWEPANAVNPYPMLTKR